MRQIWLGFDSQLARTTKTAVHKRTEKERRENIQTCLFKIQKIRQTLGWQYDVIILKLNRTEQTKTALPRHISHAF